MSAIQEYVHADDHTQPTFEMMPGFKPFAIISIFIHIHSVLAFPPFCLAHDYLCLKFHL